MKVVQINAVCGTGSTGKICMAVSELLTGKGIENYVLCSSGAKGFSNGIPCSSKLYTMIQALKSKILGNYGFNSYWETKKMLAHLEKIQPDVVHLHNIHGHDCHLGMLLTYLQKKRIRTYWTFHDCWVFTGYCPYYDMASCSKWKVSCHTCPQKKQFSWLFDRSQEMFERKKRLLADLQLTIITPSHWLAQQVNESFLSKYAVKVIHNGIDLTVFCPRRSDFRSRYGLKEKYIVLGVAFDWDPRKGLDVFAALAGRLDERFRIVLVGIGDPIEEQLPDRIIAISHTNNQTELAEIYSAADVFVNPTREENYPTVNMEAIACGTPVVTFRTGGSPEIPDNQTGCVVDRDDVDAMHDEIIRICTQKPFSKAACLRRAAEFDKEKCFKEYLSLYENG